MLNKQAVSFARLLLPEHGQQQQSVTLTPLSLHFKTLYYPKKYK